MRRFSSCLFVLAGCAIFGCVAAGGISQFADRSGIPRVSSRCAPCSGLVTGSLRLLVSVMIGRVPPGEGVVCGLDQVGKLSGRRVTRGLKVRGGAIRGRLGVTLGRLESTLTLSVLICLVLPI